MKAFLKKIKDKKDAKKGKKMTFDVASDIASKYDVKETLGKCVCSTQDIYRHTCR